MQQLLRALAIAGSLLIAAPVGIGAASAAAPAPPTLITTSYACANGVCEIGPGNVGLPFAAGLIGTGGPVYTGPECNPYTMSVVAGSLPPGLALTEDCAYVVAGTPTRAGTYTFTVQITPQPNNLGQPSGPAGAAQLTVTVGTGGADRLAALSAGYNGHGSRLAVAGYDANAGLRYTVAVTATGQVVIPAEAPTSSGGDGHWQLNATMHDPCGVSACSLTVTDSLGTTVTVTLPPPAY